MKRLFVVIMTNILWGLLTHSEPAHWLFTDIFCCDNLSQKLKKNGFLQETSYDPLIPSNLLQFRNSSIHPCDCCLLQYLLPPCPNHPFSSPSFKLLPQLPVGECILLLVTSKTELLRSWWAGWTSSSLTACSSYSSGGWGKTGRQQMEQRSLSSLCLL